MLVAIGYFSQSDSKSVQCRIVPPVLYSAELLEPAFLNTTYRIRLVSLFTSSIPYLRKTSTLQDRNKKSRPNATTLPWRIVKAFDVLVDVIVLLLCFIEYFKFVHLPACQFECDAASDPSVPLTTRAKRRIGRSPPLPAHTLSSPERRDYSRLLKAQRVERT